MNPLSRHILSQLAKRRGLVFHHIEGITLYVEAGDIHPDHVEQAIEILSDEINRGRSVGSVQIKLVDGRKS